MTKKKVAIYTCIYGGYEASLRTFAETQKALDIEFDFYCFTDNQSVINGGKNWNVVHFEPCKRYCHCSAVHYDTLGKMHNVALIRSQPHLIDCLKAYDACIYIDGNCVINDQHFFEKIVNNEFGAPKLIISQHPDRNCVYEEARISMCMAKYNNTDLNKQIETYYAEKYPQNNGLYWNGLMVYIDHTNEMFEPFYDLWSQELLKYVFCNEKSYHAQGQVSLPFVLWKTGFHCDNVKENVPNLKVLKNMYCHDNSAALYIVNHGL